MNLPRKIAGLMLQTWANPDNNNKLEVSIEPTVVNLGSWDTIAAEIGLPSQDLRWIRHGNAVYIGGDSGMAFHNSYCPVHQINFRSRTLMIRVDGQYETDKAPWHDLARDMPPNAVERLKTYNSHVTGLAEGPRAFELRPLDETGPFPPDLEGDTSRAVDPAALGQIVEEALAQIFGGGASLTDLGNGAFAIGLGQPEPASTEYVMQLKIEVDFTFGQNYPSIIQVMREATDHYVKSLGQRGPGGNGVPTELAQRHNVMSQAFVRHIAAFIQQHGEELCALDTRTAPTVDKLLREWVGDEPVDPAKAN